MIDATIAVVAGWSVLDAGSVIVSGGNEPLSAAFASETAGAWVPGERPSFADPHAAQSANNTRYGTRGDID